MSPFIQVSTDEDSDEHKRKCKELNKVRANFTICCLYPTIVMWRWQLDECQRQCKDMDDDDMRCCILICNYRILDFLPKENSNEKNFTHDPTKGMISSFMLSVGNATNWAKAVNESCSYCNEVIEKVEEFDSCGIPNHLYEIFDCAYNEIFYNCPPWNPHNITECEYTKQYIDLCFRVKN